MKFFTDAPDDVKVGVLSSANLAFAAVRGGAEEFSVAKAESIAHLLLTVGQLGVAVVTIYYILRKAWAVSTKLRARRKK